MQRRTSILRPICDFRILVLLVLAAAGAAACDDTDAGTDAAIDAPMDGPTADATDGPPGAQDGGKCGPGETLRYTTPGCGAEAKPACGPIAQDACFTAVCSCQGRTISRCEYAQEPFAAFGACHQEDAGGD